MLELCALAALAYWGSRTGGSVAANVALALAAPLLAAVAWSFLAAPPSPMRLPDTPRLLFELMVFGLAILALGRSDQRALALALAVAVVVIEVSTEALGEAPRRRRPSDRA